MMQSSARHGMVMDALERTKTLEDALYKVQEQGTVGIVPHHGRETAADIDVQGPLMTTVIDGCRFWKGRLKEATVSGAMSGCSACVEGEQAWQLTRPMEVALPVGERGNGCGSSCGD
jgi:hypothetical protein